MALRDQPYIPLYVQDVLTDEKLVECSAVAHGVYMRLLCILHKQDKYGVLNLKQKYKQTESKTKNFAFMLAKQMPFPESVIEDGLKDLLEEGVIQMTDEILSQKRMVKDGELSIMRTENGKKGGSSVTKQYGKAGFLYLMSDFLHKNKIGISSNPQNRLYRLRSDLKLPKQFDIIKTIDVDDMGRAEDMAFKYFGDQMDGEWVVGDYESVAAMFNLLEAKIKANAENAIETANASENGSEKENERFLVPQMFLTFKKHIPDYPGDIEKDFKPLGSISNFLLKQLKLTGDTVKNQPAIIKKWEELCVSVAADNFYKSKTLSVISNQIQEIFRLKPSGKKLNNIGTGHVEVPKGKDYYKKNK